MSIDYDSRGLCAYCHEPNFTGRAQFKISDHSIMHVSLCSECSNKDISEDKLMISIVKGWEKEVEQLVAREEWTQDQANEYMERYSKLKIVERV